MIVLYSLLLFLLGALKAMVGRRATGYERKYSLAVAAAQRHLNGQPSRQGNSSRSDAYQYAKHQYMLGALVQKRDQLEARHEVWQARYELLARLVAGLKNWRGRRAPYLFGVVDTALALVLIEVLGLSDRYNARALLDALASLTGVGQ